jgi:DNA-directed RNA polymerase subunit delta
MNPKKRIVKDYENLPDDILTRIKLQYPHGFAQHLISYVNKEGKKVSALPFETEDIYYLVRMTIQEARQIIADDDDYDSDGNLREDFGDSGDYASGDDGDDYDEPGEEDRHNLDEGDGVSDNDY